MVDLNRLKEYLQRTQDGINFALDQGDEAAADQHMAQADKLAQVAERVKQSQVGQESPPMPREQQGVVQPPKTAAGSGSGAPPVPEKTQDQLIEEARANNPFNRVGGPPAEYLPQDFQYVGGVLKRRKITDVPSMGYQPSPPLIEWVQPTKEELAQLERQTADRGLDAVLAAALEREARDKASALPKKTVTVTATPLVGAEPTEDDIRKQTPAAMSSFQAQYQINPKDIQTPQDIDDLLDRHTSEAMGRIYGYNKKGEVQRPKLWSWENVLLFLFSGFGPVMQKYMAEKRQWADDFKKYWDENVKGMRSARHYDIEAAREDDYRVNKMAAYGTGDWESKRLMAEMKAAEKNIENAKRALSGSKAMDAAIDPQERARALVEATETVNKETERLNSLREVFQARQKMLEERTSNPFAERPPE